MDVIKRDLTCAQSSQRGSPTDFQYFLPRGYAHENGCGGPRYEKGCCIACDPCFDTIEANLVFRPKKEAIISKGMFDIKDTKDGGAGDSSCLMYF
jgi:hypothetical protein